MQSHWALSYKSIVMALLLTRWRINCKNSSDNKVRTLYIYIEINVSFSSFYSRPISDTLNKKAYSRQESETQNDKI